MATLRGGIDLGGTKIQAVLIDGRGTPAAQARHATPTTGGPAAVADEMAATMEEAAAAAGIAVSKLAGVGVGSPGQIDEGSGVVSQARNLPGWEGSFPLADHLSRALGVPVRIGNDVQVATDAEFQLGAAKPYNSVLGVFWGTGVGGGIMLDGKPWTGRGAAGEIGHIVVKENGERCPCGRRGCMEAYAGRAGLEIRARRRARKGAKTSLFEIMESKGRTRLTSSVWAKALAEGDDLAVRLIDRAVRALGVGVASALNVLDVEAMIVGGGLGVRLGEEYVDRIRTAMMPHLFASDNPPAIRLAALGDLGGAIGAALLVPPKPKPPARKSRRLRGPGSAEVPGSRPRRA